MGDRVVHWDRVYRDTAETAVSWFQSEPTQSLALFDALHVGPGVSVVDVGAGASRLVDALLERGFDDITVLDIAAGALKLTQRRLGPRAHHVDWVVGDVLAWRPNRAFDVWHDRAVFHFLADPADQHRYVEVVESSVSIGGHVVMATFAPDGPEHCSGLPTARYDADQLCAVFGSHFDVVATEREEHTTPAGTIQAFSWTALERSAER